MPVLDRTRDQAHGRVEIRTLKAVSVRGFGFPHTKQVIQVTRKVRDLGSRRWRTTTAYAVTSLVHAQASPARLADYLRGHWSIEALHHVRDTTFAEDTSQVRTGSAPQVMAALRNLAIGVLCRAGPVNLAAALRHHSRNPLPTPGHPRHQHRMNRTSRKNPPKPYLALRRAGLRRVRRHSGTAGWRLIETAPPSSILPARREISSMLLILVVC
jgi:hypothetical protein